MNRALRAAAAILALSAVGFMAGCSSNPQTDPASKDIGLKNTAQTGAPGTSTQKQGNAATPNVDLIPAPSGVKTGTEGGRK